MKQMARYALLLLALASVACAEKQDCTLDIPDTPASQIRLFIIDPEGHTYTPAAVATRERIHYVPLTIHSGEPVALATMELPLANPQAWQPVHIGQQEAVPPLTFTKPGLYHLYANFAPRQDINAHDFFAWPMFSNYVPFVVK